MYQEAAERMITAVSEGVEKGTFVPLLEGFRAILLDNGIPASRIQLPMTKLGGFRHPMYWAVILTWSEDNGFDDTFLVTHDERSKSIAEGSLTMESPFVDGALEGGEPWAEKVTGPPKDSPFSELYRKDLKSYRVRLNEDELNYPILKGFRDQGMVDYLAFSMPLIGGPYRQFASLCSKQPFPSHVQETVEALDAIFALGMFGLYRSSQANQVVRAYLGAKTGPRVLGGAIARGQSVLIPAGVMFCDVRGFTALSQRLGGPQIVPIMNRLFEAVGSAAGAQGGEILKFIGDAMLIVFPIEEGRVEDTATAMVHAVQEAMSKVREAAELIGESLSVGFGCHLGEVVYGNIGTSKRLDFTVMGPAVNLASRLESLTKTVGTQALFSDAVAEHFPDLVSAGAHELKGIEEPVTVYRLAKE